jgi:hypothetical protein
MALFINAPENQKRADAQWVKSVFIIQSRLLRKRCSPDWLNPQCMQITRHLNGKSQEHQKKFKNIQRLFLKLSNSFFYFCAEISCQVQFSHDLPSFSFPPQKVSPFFHEHKTTLFAL